MTPKQEARKKRILKAVLSYVERNGYDGANIREIAKEAGVSPTTLYNLYGNKDKLILSAQEHVILSIWDTGEDPDRDALQMHMRRQEKTASIIRENPNWAAAMLKLTLNAGPGDRAIEVGFNQGLRGGAINCKKLQEAGLIDATVDPAQLSKANLSSIWGVLLFWMKGFIAIHDVEKELKARSLETFMCYATPRGYKTFAALRADLIGTAPQIRVSA